MFHKEGSATSSAAACSGIARKNNTNKAVDVPLRKSDRRDLRDRALAYFLRGRNTSGSSSGGSNLRHVEEHNDDETQPHSDGDAASGDGSEIHAALDEIFLKGNLSARSLPAPNDVKNKAKSLILYLKTPDSSKSSSDETHWPYETSSQFVWMVLEEKSQVILETPTVALWAALYHMMQDTIEAFAVVIGSATSKYLCRGADLMKAGMLHVPSTVIQTQESPQDTLKAAAKQKEQKYKTKGLEETVATQSMVAVLVRGNPQPFAVGLCKLARSNSNNNDSLFGPGSKGIGVEIWNCYGDDLYRLANTKEQRIGKNHLNVMGGNAPYDNGHYGNVGFVDGQYVLPLVQQEDEISEGEGDEVDASIENDQLADSRSNFSAQTDELTLASNEATHSDQCASANKDEENAMTPDRVLCHSFCQALVNLKNKDLPMPTASFYAQHVLANRPEGTTIDLKATSYKKFGNFLKESASIGLIQVGPDTSNKANNDPMALLFSYNKNHEDLQPFTKTESSANDLAAKNKLVLVSLKIVPPHWVSLLQLSPDDVRAVNATSEERKGSGMLTVSEVRKMLDEYIDREDLSSPSNSGIVVLNGPLTDAVYGQMKKQPNNNPPATISRKDLANLYANKHLPAYALVEMPGNKIVKLAKGVPPKVHLEVSRRQSNKFVTRVRGLEEYGIDPQYFCKDVKQRFAISASIDTDPASSGHAALPKKGHVELVFGANIVDELVALLSGEESLSSHGGVKNSEYSVPKQVLDVVLKKGVPGRKKKR